MTTQVFKRTSIAALAVATIATGLTFTSVDTAEAGRKDFWAGVGAGVLTGVIVNEAVRNRRARTVYVEPRPVYSSWDAHVSWCYDHYKTYSHVDDKFTSTAGYRKYCNSPYN